MPSIDWKLATACIQLVGVEHCTTPHLWCLGLLARLICNLSTVAKIWFYLFGLADEVHFPQPFKALLFQHQKFLHQRNRKGKKLDEIMEQPPLRGPLCTRSSLAADFRSLGVNPGSILLVHSSLSSLGFVCGGAEAVVLALLDVLGEKGTLVVPTHSSDNSDPAL